jgi:hypothetical protein
MPLGQTYGLIWDRKPTFTKAMVNGKVARQTDGHSPTKKASVCRELPPTTGDQNARIIWWRVISTSRHLRLPLPKFALFIDQSLATSYFDFSDQP